MKENIIIKKIGKSNNSYQCDMNESYRFADDHVLEFIFGTAWFSIIVIGIIFLVVCTPPSIKEDLTKLFPIIFFSIIGLLAIPMLTYYCAMAIRKKNYFKKALGNSIVLLGTVMLIKREVSKKKGYRITINIDGSSEIVDVTSTSRRIMPNQKVAIAKNDHEVFILVKCTLFEK